MTLEELRARVARAQQPLPAQTIHVWHAALWTITPGAEEMVGLLAVDERARADRFRFREHRDAFIAARALLRIILGHYCHSAPAELRFTYGAQGKPAIDGSNAPPARPVAFNLSHSTKAVQIAVAAEGPLGVDLEDLHRDFDLDGLIVECLSGEEARRLSVLAPEKRRKEFLRYWVHKEAFLKCAGTGFSVSPKEVNVVFGNGGRSEMQCANPLAQAILFGRDLETEPGHLAAIATPGPELVVQAIRL